MTLPSVEPKLISRQPVLIVDDEEFNRDMLKRRLEKAGYQVDQAENATQALQCLQDKDYDVVLLDHMMPGITGVELLRLLRATYSASELPVIMVTALAESHRIVEAMQAGANDYVTKPLDFPVVLARMEAQIKRKQADDERTSTIRRYARATRGADGLFDWDITTGEVYYSPEWKQMLGYDDAEIGSTIEDWISRIQEADRTKFAEHVAAAQTPGGVNEFTCEYRMTHKSGDTRWVQTRAVVERDSYGNARNITGLQSDVTISRAYDPLTRLPNRAKVQHRLEQELEALSLGESKGFAICYFGLDRFRIVNESMGISVGDRVLLEVARRLESNNRAVQAGRRLDYVARLHGDVFFVLISDLNDEFLVRKVVDRLLSSIRRPITLDGRELRITASVGVCLCQETSSRTPQELLLEAETALMRAKMMGTSRVEFFEESMRSDARMRLDLEIDLRHAVENDQLLAYYQPCVEIGTNRIIGFEALLRWKHPRYGLVSPATFIPIAEESGAINGLGEWILREACRQLAIWNREYPELTNLEMSVNLSVRQFFQIDLIEKIQAILQETGINPKSLFLEITESVFIDSMEEANAVMAKLKELGVGLKIDDFGTGYSSLNYLHSLPFDSLKIDRSFISKMLEHEGCDQVVQALISLANNLHLSVVAEGVETAQQLEHLRGLKCDYAQGYFFAKPLEAGKADTLLAAGARF